MEADIVAEGFLQSVQMHNLKYETLIADHDSSVFPRLQCLMPYGPQCPVRKIECKNHCSRNYRKNLTAITTRKEFPLPLRQFLKEGHRYLKLVNGVWAAAKYWKNNTDFCDGAQKEGEVDKVAECELPANRPFWDAVTSLASHYASYANSLIYCLDNNLAELFNNVVAKFVNGKRINFNQRGGVWTRTQAAVVSLNAEGRYHKEIHRAAAGDKPMGQYAARQTAHRYVLDRISHERLLFSGEFTAKFVERKARRLRAQRERRRRQREAAVRVARAQVQLARAAGRRQGPTQHYGLLAGINPAFDRPPLDGADLQKAMDEYVMAAKQENTPAAREALERATRLQAATANDGRLWQVTRSRSVPSTFHKRLARMRPQTSRRGALFDIRYKRMNPTKEMRHGIKFEDEAVRRFEQETGHKTTKCGLFVHPEYPWITCTPGE
ncbi:hypothetical protein ONE63_000024 [Megalurothrips usitatus]|uniref:Uncharacterized protein n=1 Tax=Megalurothrips usitatus TaxID=439358 RepID=A0AAV7XX72_9NEOP|nr:hypothetical protein ONE63_000024 [Megalurothrips usitatus]